MAVGAIVIGTLTAIVLVAIVAAGGGNGWQLAGIAAGPIFLVATVAALVTAAGAIVGGLAGVEVTKSRPTLRRAAMSLGAAIGALPGALGAAYFLGWPELAVGPAIATASAFGAVAADVWIIRRRSRGPASHAKRSSQ